MKRYLFIVVITVSILLWGCTTSKKVAIVGNPTLESWQNDMIKTKKNVPCQILFNNDELLIMGYDNTGTWLTKHTKGFSSKNVAPTISMEETNIKITNSTNKAYNNIVQEVIKHIKERILKESRSTLRKAKSERDLIEYTVDSINEEFIKKRLSNPSYYKEKYTDTWTNDYERIGTLTTSFPMLPEFKEYTGYHCCVFLKMEATNYKGIYIEAYELMKTRANQLNDKLGENAASFLISKWEEMNED